VLLLGVPIVRGTEEVKKAEPEGKLLRLPTGDGGALVFRNSLEAPVLCAMEISKALKDHPELRVRMGIHSGPVNEITDLLSLVARVKNLKQLGILYICFCPQNAKHLGQVFQTKLKHLTGVL
jgi:hypothetical protein